MPGTPSMRLVKGKKAFRSGVRPTVTKKRDALEMHIQATKSGQRNAQQWVADEGGCASEHGHSVGQKAEGSVRCRGTTEGLPLLWLLATTMASTILRMGQFATSRAELTSQAASGSQAAAPAQTPSIAALGTEKGSSMEMRPLVASVFRQVGLDVAHCERLSVSSWQVQAQDTHSHRTGCNG